MIKLETNFTSGVGGFGADVLTYKQLMRSDLAAVYERSRDGQIKDYEVTKIKIQPKGFQVMNGKPLEDDTEMYASTGQWGKSGWSFKNLGAAKAKFELLSNPAVKEVETSDDAVIEAPTEKFLNTTFIFPEKFSVKDLAETNHVEYITASLFVKEGLGNGSVKQVGEERRAAKGPMSKIYSKV